VPVLSGSNLILRKLIQKRNYTVYQAMICGAAELFANQYRQSRTAIKGGYLIAVRYSHKYWVLKIANHFIGSIGYTVAF
jgi:hypothetical protein